MTVTADPQLFVVGFMSCCCLCVSLRILVFNIMPYHIILRFYFSVLWCPLHLQHKNDFLFIPTPICFYEDSCLIYAICVCLCIVAHLFCIQHVLTMSSMAGVLFIRDMSCLLSANACTVHFVFVWGSCILTFVSFVSLCIVACVLKDASVSGLSILVYSFVLFSIDFTKCARLDRGNCNASNLDWSQWLKLLISFQPYLVSR